MLLLHGNNGTLLNDIVNHADCQIYLIPGRETHSKTAKGNPDFSLPPQVSLEALEAYISKEDDKLGQPLSHVENTYEVTLVKVTHSNSLTLKLTRVSLG